MSKITILQVGDTLIDEYLHQWQVTGHDIHACEYVITDKKGITFRASLDYFVKNFRKADSEYKLKVSKIPVVEQKVYDLKTQFLKLSELFQEMNVQMQVLRRAIDVAENATTQEKK